MVVASACLAASSWLSIYISTETRSDYGAQNDRKGKKFRVVAGEFA